MTHQGLPGAVRIRSRLFTEHAEGADTFEQSLNSFSVGELSAHLLPQLQRPALLYSALFRDDRMSDQPLQSRCYVVQVIPPAPYRHE